MATISVIIPIYKAERYLERCLLSVMEQSFRDIEIICVDDCSPDKSVSIVEGLAAADSRIRLLRHTENLGPGGARNTGIRAATTPYLTGVDSDDYIHPDMLEKLWNAARDKRADVVVCGYARVTDGGEMLRKTVFEKKTLSNTHNDIDIFSAANPSFNNKLWRRELYTDNNIFFPTHGYYEDLATTPRILYFSKTITFVSDVLYYYVVRENSLTHSSSAKHIVEYLVVFDLLYDFLVQRNIYERYKKAFLKLFDDSLVFHASNVMASKNDDESKRRYLRHLLRVKFGFHEAAKDPALFVRQDARALLNCLGAARTMDDISPPARKQNGLSGFWKKFFSSHGKPR